MRTAFADIYFNSNYIAGLVYLPANGENQMLNSNSWLEQVSQRLAVNAYNPMPPEKYQPQNFMYAVHRSRFEITKFGIAEYFFTFAEIPNLTIGTLQQFSAA